MVKAAFLGRDGVINRKAPEGHQVTGRREDMDFLPSVASAITLLNQAGFRVIVVSNQRSVAKEVITIPEQEALDRRMCDSLASEGAILAGVYFCPHTTERSCACRKPTGMLLEAARTHNVDLSASWMIGDSGIDMEAGRNAGCKTAQLISDHHAADAKADIVAGSLFEVSREILQREENSAGEFEDPPTSAAAVLDRGSSDVESMSGAVTHQVEAQPNPSAPEETQESWIEDVAPQDLTRRTTRGAMVSTIGQGSMLVLRTGSLMVLARLLLKEDFGLINMVTAFTGFLSLFRDAGLSMATVQRASISRAQISTLFWANLAVGGLLSLLALAAAPLLVAFYSEPRLFWVTVALGTGFLFTGAAAQHRAMLQRSMRFTALSIVDVGSIVLSIALAIGVALKGHGYWALVTMSIAQPAISLPGVWIASGWIPGRPQSRSGIRSMLAYGGAVTLNNLIIYIAYNADKVLVGRFWGTGALGIYGRAYQLINLPNENLFSTIGQVAFPALSRVQADAKRLRSSFLKGYSLCLSLGWPITMSCALFAKDIVLIFLGPKWLEAASVFRLLAPTILCFALIIPFTWLMLAVGRTRRFLKLAVTVAPVLILSYSIGLKYGTRGVAIGFSIGIAACVVPFQICAKRGTLITMRDICKAVAPSFTSIATGAIAVLAIQSWLSLLQPVFLRLIVEAAILFGVYALILLFVMRQNSVYLELLHNSGLKLSRAR